MTPTTDPREPLAASLGGVRVRLLGRFASMPRLEAAAAVARRGGELVEESPQWVVVGEESTAEQRSDAESAARESGAERIDESELWRRLGVVDGDHGVRRLYSPAMLAELVGAPLAAVRRWDRRGHLTAAIRMNRLAYFAFEEARVARRLASLLAAGNSLDAVDRMVDRLAAAYPGTTRPLAELPLVVEDGALCLRGEAGLTESTGQRRFDFERSGDAPPGGPPSESPGVLPFVAPESRITPDADARQEAIDKSDHGDLPGAIEALRLAMLQSPVTAEDHFTLAEWLYGAGERRAARERYYAALELDEDYLEARVSLGCLLVELGDDELAAAAFRGAIDTHGEFADAHFHLAQTLDRLGDRAGAHTHWLKFLEVAPEGPWADEARDRLAERG